MDIIRPIRKFNPGTLQSDEDLKSQFVVRQNELNTLLEILRENTESLSCQHALVVAPRGRGKTMLLARVAAELRSDPVLSERLLPVRFMEENHEIFDMADFFLDVLLHLAGECAKSEPGLASELHDTRHALASKWREELVSDYALGAALDASDRMGKRLVLMVENLQSLCDNVDEDFGWKFRQILQTQPRIMLLASATSRFDGLDDAKQPFFELFRLVDLPPLDTESCGRLWEAFAGGALGRQGIRPLQILTGGSPRLLVIVAEFARHRSPRRLIEELVKMIDDHTEYFRNHLEILPKTERRVYLALIDLWQPSTTGEIASRARMDVRPVSTLLGRLVQRGAVSVDATGTTRLYVATERLYSIYYKLRRNRDEATVVRNLIRFMSVFYSEAELARMSDLLMEEIRQWRVHGEQTNQSIGAIGNPRTRHAVYRRSGGINPQIERLAEEVIAANNGHAFGEILQLTNDALASHDDGSTQLVGQVLGLVLSLRGCAFAQLGELNSAIATFDQLLENVECWTMPDCEIWICRALVYKAIAQQRVGDVKAAEATMARAVQSFGSMDDPEISKQISLGLVAKADWLGPTTEAIATCDEIVERFADSTTPYVQEGVALALRIKGMALWDMGRPDDEIAVYEEMADRFGAIEEPTLRKHLISALQTKAETQRLLGRHEDAIETNDHIVAQFADGDSLETRVMVAESWCSKGDLLVRTGRAEEALDACESIQRLFRTLRGKDDVPFGWRAEWIRARSLTVLRNNTAAVEAFRSICREFVVSNDEMMLEMQTGVADLIAMGAQETDLIETLSEDSEKSEVLIPLVVALRQLGGEDIRAPQEVLDVAADIRERIAKRAEASR